MKILIISIMGLFFLSGCQQQTNDSDSDLTGLKNEFIEQIHTCCIDEGPFSFNYSLRTVLFSKHIVSLFGEFSVHDRLPHGWKYYEGKTFYTENNRREELFLKDLFKTDAQKECLRQICENAIKKEALSYFTGKEPLRTTLAQNDINTFVVDDNNLIIIFQPYIVGGGADGPFIVKIPYNDLTEIWQKGNPLEKYLPITKNFLSSWDEENWISDIQEDHSIAYQKKTKE